MVKKNSKQASMDSWVPVVRKPADAREVMIKYSARQEFKDGLYSRTERPVSFPITSRNKHILALLEEGPKKPSEIGPLLGLQPSIIFTELEFLRHYSLVYTS